MERLAKVEAFAFGPTGYAGIASQGEKDHKLILSRPSASADFERLFSVGNAQAKSYALAGLRTISPKRYEELSRALRGSNEMVVIQSGCIEWQEPLSDTLKRITARNDSGPIKSPK